MYRDTSQCEYQNKEARLQNGDNTLANSLTPAEVQRFGFCKEPNGFRCHNENCPGHIANAG